MFTAHFKFTSADTLNCSRGAVSSAVPFCCYSSSLAVMFLCLSVVPLIPFMKHSCKDTLGRRHKNNTPHLLYPHCGAFVNSWRSPAQLFASSLGSIICSRGRCVCSLVPTEEDLKCSLNFLCDSPCFDCIFKGTLHTKLKFLPFSTHYGVDGGFR